MNKVLLLTVLLLAAACGDQVQKAKPPERPASGTPSPHGDMPPDHPPLSSDHPTIGHGTATRSAPNPHAADPFAEGDAGAKPAMGEAPAGDPKKIVMAGEITLDASVKVGETFVIYVASVFSPQERAPVYIKKYDSPKFPFRFELTEQDKGAAGGTQSDQPLYLRAMISDTGDAMKNRNRTTSEQSFPRGTTDAKLTIK